MCSTALLGFSVFLGYRFVLGSWGVGDFVFRIVESFVLGSFGKWHKKYVVLLGVCKMVCFMIFPEFAACFIGEYEL